MSEQLPKVGQVWGDLNRPSTWRFIHSMFPEGVWFYRFIGLGDWCDHEDWQSWSRDKHLISEPKDG